EGGEGAREVGQRVGHGPATLAALRHGATQSACRSQVGEQVVENREKAFGLFAGLVGCAEGHVRSATAEVAVDERVVGVGLLEAEEQVAVVAAPQDVLPLISDENITAVAALEGV